MPQCIAQQDQSAWLGAMTKCTHKKCTSYFLFPYFCTHQQWLTESSCLGTELSSDVIRKYLPYCSRSVLGKAQLYHWVRAITGRTWFINVGDANGLDHLSPASLTNGYAATGRTRDAPTCLKDSFSAESTERFQHVMGSCSFTSTTYRTGNAARPWEYHESQKSMVALGFETVGYDLTGGSIGYGDYFDKECFCSTFATDFKHEPCSTSGQIDLTRERLWFNATCGPAYLPDDWTDAVKTVGFTYIPVQDWHWPKCFADMPKQVTGLTDKCETDACELDSSGYCKVKRAIDRSCFCRDISYDSCGGSCRIFETRIDYVHWLHDLCGNVQDWRGLPDNWQRLGAPTPLEMIPWRWTVKPSNSSTPHFESQGTTPKCASNEWKLGSMVLINIAALLAAFFSQRKGTHKIARDSQQHRHHWSWFIGGMSIAGLQLLANCVNGLIVQWTPGYEDVPVGQLILLWCSMPRLAWVLILPLCVRRVPPSEAADFPTAASSLFAEGILQVLSSCYMFLTVYYGLEHNFYLRSLEHAERGRAAQLMYAGALLWFILIAMTFAQLIQAIYRMDERKAPREDSGEALLKGIERGSHTIYGTVPVQRKDTRTPQRQWTKLYTITATSMLLLWASQWLFWGGFIGLSSKEYVSLDACGPFHVAHQAQILSPKA